MSPADVALLVIVLCMLLLVGAILRGTFTLNRLAHDLAGSTRQNEWQRGYDAGRRDEHSATTFPVERQRREVLLAARVLRNTYGPHAEPGPEDDLGAAVVGVIDALDRLDEVIDPEAAAPQQAPRAPQPARQPLDGAVVPLRRDESDEQRLDALLTQVYPESPSVRADYRAAVSTLIARYDDAGSIDAEAVRHVAAVHGVYPRRASEIAHTVLGARS